MQSLLTLQIIQNGLIRILNPNKSLKYKSVAEVEKCPDDILFVRDKAVLVIYANLCWKHKGRMEKNILPAVYTCYSQGYKSIHI